MTERVRVAVRIRPFLASDPEDADLTTLMVDDTHVCCNSQRVFRVDKVYKMEDETADVYLQSVKPLVDDFLLGFNATVLAYGQTGTGKTHTISGLLPLILGQIINEGFNGSTDALSFQYIEVYGDSLRDLLSEDPVASAKGLHIFDGVPSTVAPYGSESNVIVPGSEKYSLSPTLGDGSPMRVVQGREQAIGSVVSGALRVTASSLTEVFDILAFGTANRTTGATNVHQHSSRSHSVFTVFNHHKLSKMHIVDLAGSERNKKTLNEGQRLQESIAINAGLLALGNVIRALSRNHTQQHPQRPNDPSNIPTNFRGTSPPTRGGAPSPLTSASLGHVPYRSSKLTRLLQDALGGCGKTLFIACVAPDSYNQDETLRTLQYCPLAMKVVNTPLKQYEEMHRRQLERAGRRVAKHGQTYASADSPSFLDPSDVHGGLLNGGRDEGVRPVPSRQDVSHGRDVELQREVEMLRQFAEEQETEILTMRGRLADAHAKIEVCEEELRKDEAIFSRQITEMERLVKENKELRKRLQEGARREAIQEHQYRQLLDKGVRDSKRDYAGETLYNSRSSELVHPLEDRHSPDEDFTDATTEEDPIHDLKKTLPFLRKTVHLSGASGPTAPGNGNALPPAVRNAAARSERDGSSAQQENWEKEIHAIDAQLQLAENGNNRDEQLLALTKDALHYQRANAQLRREMSTLKIAMESQQRDAAMLRLELDDLRQYVNQ